MIDYRVPVINTEFYTEEFEDEMLLYTISDSKAVYLNTTAYLVWQLCGEKRTVEEITVLLEEVYPDQKSEVREDVGTALKTLCDIGAIVF